MTDLLFMCAVSGVLGGVSMHVMRRNRVPFGVSLLVVCALGWFVGVFW